MTNARLLTNEFTKPYMSINREERNLTALLDLKTELEQTS